MDAPANITNVFVRDQDLGEFLINNGLARPYESGKREPWFE